MSNTLQAASHELHPHEGGRFNGLDRLDCAAAVEEVREGLDET